MLLNAVVEPPTASVFIIFNQRIHDASFKFPLKFNCVEPPKNHKSWPSAIEPLEIRTIEVRLLFDCNTQPATCNIQVDSNWELRLLSSASADVAAFQTVSELQFFHLCSSFLLAAYKTSCKWNAGEREEERWGHWAPWMARAGGDRGAWPKEARQKLALSYEKESLCPCVAKRTRLGHCFATEHVNMDSWAHHTPNGTPEAAKK